jgi:hypothetical protein
MKNFNSICFTEWFGKTPVEFTVTEISKEPRINIVRWENQKNKKLERKIRAKAQQLSNINF